MLHRAVPFTGTAGIQFMAPERVEVPLTTAGRCEPHRHGVHASAMNLLAETASGMVVGMNVRDDCLPLASRSPAPQRATGDLKAPLPISVPMQQQACSAPTRRSERACRGDRCHRH